MIYTIDDLNLTWYYSPIVFKRKDIPCINSRRRLESFYQLPIIADYKEWEINDIFLFHFVEKLWPIIGQSFFVFSDNKWIISKMTVKLIPVQSLI